MRTGEVVSLYSVYLLLKILLRTLDNAYGDLVELEIKLYFGFGLFAEMYFIRTHLQLLR